MSDDTFDWSKGPATVPIPADAVPAANGTTPSAKPAKLIAGFNATDYGNAERLVALHGHDLRYVPGRGWHTWDGQRWQRDETGETVRRMKDTVRTMFTAAGEIEDAKQRQAVAQHALKSEAARALAAAITLAESEAETVAHTDALDADPWLLNVNNGTIDLTTGRKHPHDRGDLITKIAGTDHDPDATCPTWETFLARVLDNDTDLAELLQRAVGYSLTGTTGEQVLFIVHGSGANGKSTFLEVLRALHGDYGQQAPPELLVDRRNIIPNDVARLPGVRCLAAAESEAGGRLNESLVKSLTGGDTVTARFMRGEWFEFKPQFTPWLATNHKPTVRGTDEAIWRRIRLIPFNVTIPPEQRDPDLPAKLRAELAGILNWAIAGCLAWQADGLTNPDAVQAATAEYRAEQDVVGAFIDEACVVLPQLSATSASLYEAYTDWCLKAGERRPLTKRAFGGALTDRGFERGRTDSARKWLGIGLLYTQQGMTHDTT